MKVHTVEHDPCWRSPVMAWTTPSLNWTQNEPPIADERAVRASSEKSSRPPASCPRRKSANPSTPAEPD